MDEQKKTTARKKRIVGTGTGVEKQGEGLGTGPVNNAGNYEKRKEQHAQQQAAQQEQQRPAQQSQRPAGGTFGTAHQRPAQQSQRPAGGAFGATQQRPAQQSQRPAGGTFGAAQQRPAQQSQRPAGGAFGATQQRPAQQRPAQQSQRPAGGSFGTSQQAGRAGSSRPAGSTGSQGSSSQRSGAGGGGSKLILLIAAAALLFFFGRGTLFGGGTDTSVDTQLTAANTQNQSISQQNVSGQESGTGGLMNLLSSFLGSGESSAYDFSGVLSGLTGGSGSTGSPSGVQQYFTSSMENNTAAADESVSQMARDKFTVIKGNNKDQVTLLVYMCGTDLESQNGMGTADLKEMVNAEISDQINLIVYTGGCRKWRNNVVSSSVNQIYQIKNGSLYCLEDNCGNASMTSPSTLASFIQYGKEHFPANRMCLIFWDHGGGSVSGYGYDEKYGQGQSMTLSGINEALKKGGVQFDFIGFDACLMATVENGLMLSQYADYMIASEETEPGVGWYYTNWLNRLSRNSSLSTVQIGKIITDDFVDVCNQKCRGQATTLSVVDLAELAATVPAELKEFSTETNDLIQNKQYKTVSAARSKTREFAQQSRIDQIDLVHFAKNLGTDEANQLAEALQGAVKYNRTGGGISNAYGLSIYFPYKKTEKVKQMVATYQAIGMDDEYTRCIQEFASLELSGQLSAGTSVQNYGSYASQNAGLMDSLLGGGNAYGSTGNSYSQSGLEELLGGFFGGSSSSSGNTGSILDLLIGRSMTSEKAAEYIAENHFDPSALVWKNNRITLSEDQWDFLEDIQKNVFYDDGTGFIDLGFDPVFERDGNDLVYEFDGTWLSIDRHPVAYYRMSVVEQNDAYAEIGYVPAMVNDVRANLILVFDSENPYGYIAGAQKVYPDGETETAAKTMISIGKGDRIHLVCDFFDYEENYKDSYFLGSEFVLGEEVEIGNTYIDAEKCRVTYCLTDYYQQSYWTPAVQ